MLIVMLGFICFLLSIALFGDILIAAFWFWWLRRDDPEDECEEDEEYGDGDYEDYDR